MARGRIVAINASAALNMVGVQAIYTQEDLAAAPLAMMNFFLGPIVAPVTPLAHGRVACVGDPVALVIAESRAIAEDAAGLIELEIQEEEPVVTIAEPSGRARASRPSRQHRGGDGR